jgi:nucleoside-diphosphate-sugar epimerase
MSSTETPPILIVGATGRTGSAVVDELRNADVPLRTLTRRPEAVRHECAGAVAPEPDSSVPLWWTVRMVG